MPTRQANSAVTGAPNSLYKKRVLIADDDNASADVLMRMLHRLGAHTERASDGALALQRLGDTEFDIALLDFQMPGLDGPAVVQQCRAQRIAQSTVLIIVTADTTAESKRVSVQSGADAYLNKPIAMHELAHQLGRHLDKQCVQASDAVDQTSSIDTDCWNQLSLLGDQPGEFLAKIYAKFSTDNHTLCLAIEAAIQDRDWPACAALLHRLHGSAVSVGAIGVVHAVQCIQQLPQEVAATQVTQLCDELRNALMQVQQDVAIRLAQLASR